MKYRLDEMDTFLVIGQETQLTHIERKNIEISQMFWKQFNLNLKKAYLLQHGNWTKYAFIKRHNDLLFYICCIPQKSIVPDGFVKKEIPASKYLVFEHMGAMNNIYNTYRTIYKDLLPLNRHSPKQDEFLHFEKYDYRFSWNRPNSVIEIWIPIK